MNNFELPTVGDAATPVTLNFPWGSHGTIQIAPIDPNQPVVFSTDLPDATVSVNSDGEIIK